jgi:hypothetical protein
MDGRSITDATRVPVPRRIVVIGNAGTGKSTLALQIGRLLDVETIHLDRMLWKPGWEMVDEEAFRALHAGLLAKPCWVIEGLAYPSTIEARFAAADAIVFLRYPLWRCYWWSLKRELRPGAASGRPDRCPRFDALARLIRAIWETQRKIVPQIELMLEREAGDRHVRVLLSPKEVPTLLGAVRTWTMAEPAAPPRSRGT